MAETETVRNAFIGIDTVQKTLHNFMRWQQEIAGLDNGLIKAVIPQAVLEEKYPKLGELSKSKKIMKEVWRRFLEEAERFMQKMFAWLNKRVDSNIQYLDSLEKTIEDAIEAVEEENPDKAETLKEIKQEVTKLKNAAKTQKDDLEETKDLDDIEEKKSRFKTIGDAIALTAHSIGRITSDYYKIIKTAVSSKNAAQSVLAAEAVMHSYSYESTIKTAMNKSAHSAEDEETEEETEIQDTPEPKDP